MDKNILRYLEKLPIEYRQKAIDNHKNDKTCHYNPNKPQNLYSALSLGFVWCNTPEGDNFWRRIYNRIEEGEIVENVENINYQIY